MQNRRNLHERRKLVRRDQRPLSLAALVGWAGCDDPGGLARAEAGVSSVIALIPIIALTRAGVLAEAVLFALLGWAPVTAPDGLVIGAGALAVELAGWWGLRRIARRKVPPHLIARLITGLSIVTGIGWAVLLLPGTGVSGTAVGVGALVGTCILAPVPVAAIAHVVALAIVISGLWDTPPHAVAAILTTTAIAYALIVQARRADQERRQAMQEGHHLVKAQGLLAEFEESGKGWFWETDAVGRLTYVSAQLATSLGTDVQTLIGTPLTELFRDESATEGESPRGERTVGFHLSARFAFSDVVVRAAAADPPRWWSLSGRPAVGRYGDFLGFRGSGTDLTEMRRSEAEVSRLARYDALTGLPNRMLMRQTLEAALREANQHGESCALFLLDLDRFKSVNDTLGHPVGDMLLRQVSERLLGVIGEEGRVGRLGGDEFKVVVPAAPDRAKLAQLADAVIARLSMPYLLEGASVSIGASVGIAVGPADGDCPDSLIRNADLALYAAKADGKGVHRFYESEMHASAKERRLLEEDLRNALGEKQGLELVFQPIVNATSEAIVGFEALARWRHPTRGYVSPALFIPLAEEIGLIPQIGEWVIRNACREAAKWPDNVRVAVNISPLQFANPSLPAIVMSALAEAQLAPMRLELEITEGVFLNDSAESEAMFARLGAIGVRFALDDFGTGYSSLGYLKKAPFNKIKIDQSFVRGAAISGNRNAAIIRAIVTLAENLGMETTAEGAETHDELDLIRSLGCSQIQGHIFGRPMSAEDALARVRSGGTLTPEGFSAQRPARIAVLRSALLWRQGFGQQRIRLRNISEGGALVETDRDVPEGCAIEIEFPDGGRIAGAVRWSQAGRFGIQFEEGFEIERLNAIRAPAKPATARQTTRGAV